MDFRILNLIATIIEFCVPRRERGRGHPPAEIVRVVATLRQFLREGTPWRSLRATASKVSGSTLRRHLERWAQNRAGRPADITYCVLCKPRPDSLSSR